MPCSWSPITSAIFTECAVTSFSFSLRRIAALQEEKADLERRVREKEKEVTAHSVKIAEVMGDHEHGILETASDKLIVDFVSKFTRRVDSDLLKKAHPATYEAVLKTTDSRKVKVAVHAS
jgi:predicted phage-related endonuclease